MALRQKWNQVAVAAFTGVLSLGMFTAPAAADIANFSDLGPACSPSIPGVYHGLTFSSNFQVECNADYASTYNNSYGAASGYAATNGSLNSGVSEVSVSAGTFDLVSAAFSSFAGSNNFQSYSAESLQIFAYRPGDTVDNPTFVTTIDLDPTQYVASTLNWTGIDAVFFGAGNGPASDPGTIYGADGLSWLLTDVDAKLNPPIGAVPEADSILLLGTCVAGIALARRRKRSTN
jgi:hypothetical protein